MAARTIKIEIPVEVVDNTSSGTSGVVQNLSKMEKAMQRMEKQSKQHVSKMEESMQRKERGIEKEHEVEILANDHATPVIRSLEDALAYVSGLSPEVGIGVNDSATPVIKGIEDSVSQTDGTSAEVGIGVNDSATPVIKSVEDSAENLDGISASAEVGVNDHASSIIDMVRDKLHSLGGMAVSAIVGAADTASGVIDSVIDKLSSYSGTTWNATVGVVNAVTSPLGKIGSIAGNPLAQAGAVAGVSFGVADTVDTYKDFESMMSSVKAISNANESDFAALTEKAKQMGADTKFSAYESAEAFNYMAMAGWKTKDMMGGIEGIMSLAAASGEDLGSTSDIVTDALTAFGMQASESTHFADVLAQASANANTNVSMLGESFKYVAPVAGTMGYSIEDTSLALGLMANAGIKGSMSGTALKTSIANLASPTANMAAAMDKYGISLTDNEGNMKSLKGVMDNLRTSLGGLSETEQTAAASTIFGKEAMSGMLAIINAAEEDYNKLTEAVYNADGASQKMADTMMDNLDGSFELLSGVADEVKMTLGERLSPYLRGAADALAAEMPGVKEKINEIMDYVDTNVSSMTVSAGWNEADLLGKVNIAWDTLIADPFMDWIGGSGKHLISTGIGKLFSEAMKLSPGGQQAGLTSWLSAGILAKGIVTTATGVMKLTDAFGGLGSLGGKIGLVTAAAAAGIGAVAVAIDNYNEKQISDSLEEHFGKIELSAEYAKEFADHLMGIEFKTGITTSLDGFKNAEQLRESAEAALAANDSLEWKCSVGLTLTEAEGESYMENVQTFVESKRGELESAARAASVAIETIIGGEKGVAMNKVIGSWLAADEADISGLSAKLTATVEDALTDGIIGVKEQAAIDALQGKINTILSSWSATQADTQIDMIRMKYGHLTGKDLEAGAFSEIITSFQESRATTETEIETLSEEFFGVINGAFRNGKIDYGEMVNWKNSWNAGVLSKRGSALANALEFETNTLQDTYGSEISKTLAGLEGNATKGIQNQMNSLFAGGGEIDLAAFQDYMNTGIMGLKGAGNPALKRLYETMEPDVQAMGQLMDDYREQFGYIPKNLKQAYDEAIDVGAAAGSESAAMQKYANALLEHGSQDVVDALTNPSNPLYEGIRSAVPELGTAIDRAFAETGEAIEIDDLMARIKGLKVDDSEAKASVEDALQKFEQSISESGSQVEVTAEGVQVTLGSAEVNGQSAIEQIAAAVNMSADELAQANSYGSAIEVPIGATITIPSEAITFDTSALENAAQTAADGTEPAPVETETAANVTVTEGKTDASQARAQAQSETEDAFDEPFPADSDVDLTLTHNNSASEAARIYSEVDGQVKGAFAAGYSATADVSVHLNWHLLNPSINIATSSSGSSVSASIATPHTGFTPHAEGGLFGNPHLGLVAEDGPEAIIPLGSKRRERGIDLWMQAGAMLGVSQYAEGGIIGKSKYSSDLFRNSEDSEDSRDSSENKIGISVDTGGSRNVQVSVNMSPVFEISNDNPDTVMKLIRSQFKELTNDMTAEIARRVADSFANTPA